MSKKVTLTWLGFFVAIESSVTSYANMAPGNIDDFVGTYTLRVANSPSKASSSSAPGIGAVGLTVSGAVI